MRYGKLLMCALPLLAIAGCDSDGITELGPPPPAATVRFVNASTDWGTLDLRFPDQVENLPTLLGVAIRSSSGFYQRVNPGTRATRVFPYSTNVDTTKTILVDAQLPLTSNQRYTFVYNDRGADGAALAAAQRLHVIEEPADASLPTPATGRIAIRVLHAASRAGNVDVYIVPVDSANAPTPADWQTNNAGVVSNLAFRAASQYNTNVPVRTGNQLYRFVVTAPGAATPLFTSTPTVDNQAGAAAPVPTTGPRPGTRISGSVLTAVIVGGTTPGTRGSATANQSPAVFVIVDKVLDPAP